MLEELIVKAGGKRALARLLGISGSAVVQWKVIPNKRLLQLMNLKPEWFKENP